MIDNDLYTDDREKELLGLLAQGDESAFTLIVRRYTSIIYHHLVSQLRDHHLAQELTQNIFISLWNNRAKLPGIQNFPGYVYVMARNTAHKAFLRLAAKNESLPEDMIQTILQTPQSALEMKELRLVLDKGIAALPDRRREVFELSRMENMSYEEIATKLGISRSAVKQHIVAARVFLRTWLREHARIVIPVLFLVFIQYFLFFPLSTCPLF